MYALVLVVASLPGAQFVFTDDHTSNQVAAAPAKPTMFVITDEYVPEVNPAAKPEAEPAKVAETVNDLDIEERIRLTKYFQALGLSIHPDNLQLIREHNEKKRRESMAKAQAIVHCTESCQPCTQLKLNCMTQLRPKGWTVGDKPTDMVRFVTEEMCVGLSYPWIAFEIDGKVVEETTNLGHDDLAHRLYKHMTGEFYPGVKLSAEAKGASKPVKGAGCKCDPCNCVNCSCGAPVASVGSCSSGGCSSGNCGQRGIRRGRR